MTDAPRFPEPTDDELLAVDACLVGDATDEQRRLVAASPVLSGLLADLAPAAEPTPVPTAARDRALAAALAVYDDGLANTAVVTAAAPVVDLAARRRARQRGLLAAAAAVVVLAGVGALVVRGGGSSSKSASATTAAQAAGAAATTAAAATTEAAATKLAPAAASPTLAAGAAASAEATTADDAGSADQAPAAGGAATGAPTTAAAATTAADAAATAPSPIPPSTIGSLEPGGATVGLPPSIATPDELAAFARTRVAAGDTQAAGAASSCAVDPADQVVGEVVYTGRNALVVVSPSGAVRAVATDTCDVLVTTGP